MSTRRKHAACVDSLCERETLRVGEFRTLDVARSHIDAAKVLYESGKWPQACFLAMSAVEEIGRALILQRALAEEDTSDLSQLRTHPFKALMGAVAPLIMNDEAQKRHGRSRFVEVDRVEAVRLIAEAPGEWMSLKNACLYLEVDLATGTAVGPVERITREHAYLMIVGALEVYAKFHSPFFTFHRITADQGREPGRHALVVEEITQFVEQEAGKVDLDRLDFLGNPARVRSLRAAVRESRKR